MAVANVMLKVSKSSALPVLDEHGRLTGIITDRDIFNKAYLDGAEAAAALGFGEDEDHWSWDGLRNVMKLWYEVSKIELPGLPIKEHHGPRPYHRLQEDRHIRGGSHHAQERLRPAAGP